MFTLLRSDLEKSSKLTKFVAGAWVIWIVMKKAECEDQLLKDLMRLSTGSTCRWKQVTFCVGKCQIMYMRKHHSSFSLIPCKILVSQLSVTCEEDLRIVRHTSLQKVSSKLNSNQKRRSDAEQFTRGREVKKVTLLHRCIVNFLMPS